MKHLSIHDRQISWCSVALVVSVCAFCLLGIGLVGFEICFDKLEKMIIESRLPIIPGTRTYEQISAKSSDVLFKVWAFNITNFKNISRSEKPKLKAVGPYVYRLVVEKINITFTSEGPQENFMNYREKTSYVFDSELSNGDPKTDSITVPNLISTVVGTWLYSPFSTRKSQDIIWGGKNFAFGLFSSNNNSIDGPFSMYTGVGNINKLGNIRKYKNKTFMSTWKTDYANQINGTTDVFTPPNLKIGDVRYMFGPSICRSVPLTATRWVSAANFPELKLISLDLNEDVFCSANTCHANAVFHEKSHGIGNGEYTYPPRGLLSMKTCVGTLAPIFLSQPFFRNADAVVKDAVTFEPHAIEDEFKTEFHVEPKTGIVLEGSQQYQLNVYQKVNRKHVYMPMVYVQKGAVVTEESAKELYNLLYVTPHIYRTILRVSIGLCFMIALCLLAVLIIRYKP